MLCSQSADSLPFDELPEIAGIDRFYGRSVHHCPYCDGWEWRDQPIAVYGRGEKGAGLALMLTLWSHDVVLCTDGAGELPTEERARLGRNAIALREEPIARLEGSPDGQLECVVFADGAMLPRRALFFNTGQYQRSPLLAQLGCDFSAKGGAETGDFEETNVPGIYAVGDASRDVQLVVIAAAEGARAACAINKALLKEAGLL
jgi:thioredoxin reductase